MGGTQITEYNTLIREGTTRYVSITCKNEEGAPFDFEGFDVQTHLSFGANRRYVPTSIIDNIVSYKIPADISVSSNYGIAETRIFKNGDVYEVLRINVTVEKANKPDLVPHTES